MNFLQRIFGSAEESPEEKKKKETEARQFDALKYDGIAALKIGQVDYAVTCFSHALQLRDDLEIHDHLSVAYIHQNQMANAVNELRLLADAQPDNQAVWVRMARVCYMMEDYDQMAEACERAEAVGAGSAEVSYLYAEARQGQGDKEAAVALLGEAIARDEHHDVDYLLEHADLEEDIVLLKARIAHRGGDQQKAVEWYGRVIDTNPFCLAAFRARAEVYREMGETQLSEADAATAAELEPKEMADISDGQSAEGIEQKTKEAYKNTLNPFGL